MIQIDGSFGEGGGQILRTSLTLSMLTRKPIQISQIRKGRNKPGILRQHLACIQAAKAVCAAEVSGDHLGSDYLVFSPKSDIENTEYHFKLDGAGSTSLVLQTLLPIVATQKNQVSLRLEGGTHNPFAPSYDFLERCYFPLVERWGLKVESELIRYGFYPVGGGEVCYTLKPEAEPPSIDLLEKGKLGKIRCESVVARLSPNIAERESREVRRVWPKAKIDCHFDVESLGPGNALCLDISHEHVHNHFTAFGTKGVRAESVAKKLIKEAKAFLDSDAVLNEHLADQWVLLLAMGGGGRFTTNVLSGHLQTQIAMIQRFLAVNIETHSHAKHLHEIRVITKS